MLTLLRNAFTEVMGHVSQCQSQVGGCAWEVGCYAFDAPCQSRFGCCAHDAPSGAVGEPSAADFGMARRCSARGHREDVEESCDAEVARALKGVDWWPSASHALKLEVATGTKGVPPAPPSPATSTHPSNSDLGSEFCSSKRMRSRSNDEFGVPHYNSSAMYHMISTPSNTTRSTGCDSDQPVTEATLSDWDWNDDDLNEQIASNIAALRENTFIGWYEEESDAQVSSHFTSSAVNVDGDSAGSREHTFSDLLDKAYDTAELQSQSEPLPTLLRCIGRGHDGCCARGSSDKVAALKLHSTLVAERTLGEDSRCGHFQQGESIDKPTQVFSLDDSTLSLLQSRVAFLTEENTSLREKNASLREKVQARLANNTALSNELQCSKLLRSWAATVIQSAERGRAARRKAAAMRETSRQTKTEEDAKTVLDSHAKERPVQKGKGKGAAPPQKGSGKGAGAPGGKGKPLPIKPDVIPSVPLKKLYWNPISLAGAPGEADHSTLWGKIHRGRKPLRTVGQSELEALFADAPSKAGKQGKSTEQHEGQKLKLRRLFDEKRRRQIWFMMASLPERNQLPDAIVKMNDTELDPEKVDLLISNLPTPDEESMISAAMRDTVLEDGEAWDVAEVFVGMLIAIPQCALRIEVWGFMNSLPNNLSVLSNVLDDLQEAFNVLQKSSCLEKMLALILYVGNVLNGGTPRGRADGFDMDTLTKLGKLKASDKDFEGTLIDFIVKQMQQDDPGMLAELFAPEGEFHVLHRARRHKLGESQDELGCLIRQAEEYLQRIDNQAGPDESLAHRKEKLLEHTTKLRNLKEGFDELRERYAALCAWFCIDTGKLKPTDEFLGLWNTFLLDVKKGLESLDKKQRAVCKLTRRPDDRSASRGASQSITQSRLRRSSRQASLSPESSQGTASRTSSTDQGVDTEECVEIKELHSGQD